ncbi:nuclear transport factor 2 family protein [uncultured Aquimonas sp.]|uniref:nuclear transport factor 2 family protein n=1 Tax=uncultured Aquimonas sp. TaxID=385483 RepID=UPI0008694213|nr:nuclear transport factor 2 family protein [uncultured Aquimonas sp.]ODU46566.1 MAG: steroid delta-isomerase [Xanthomonadaceae bacterium SCN 69-123]
MSPIEVAQHQLDAYNAHDLQRFLEVYAEDVEVWRMPASEPSLRGRAALGEFYANERFHLPALHAELVNRIAVGDTVVDHERVSGLREQPFEVVAVYRISGGLIRCVWFHS